jgi:hypothetical protein
MVQFKEKLIIKSCLFIKINKIIIISDQSNGLTINLHKLYSRLIKDSNKTKKLSYYGGKIFAIFSIEGSQYAY